MNAFRRLLGANLREATGRVAGFTSVPPAESVRNHDARGLPAIERALFHRDEGRFAESLAALDAVGAPGNSLQQTYAKAVVLASWGRHWEAHRLFERLHDAGFRAARFDERLGWSYLSCGDVSNAETSMRAAVAAAPADWRSHFGLGEALRQQDLVGAKEAFDHALRLSPGNVHCLLNICACHLSRDDVSAAESPSRLATEVAPNESAAWTNFGFVLLRRGRLDDAYHAFAEGERLNAADNEDLDDLSCGFILRLLGRTQAAIEYFERNLVQHPSVSGHTQYALALLTAGRLKEGFEQLEFRWMESPLRAERFRGASPCWSGQDLAGKSVLVRSEQGAGDVLQFIRYLPELKRRGASVLLEVHPALEQLSQSLASVDKTYSRGAATSEFDYYIDMVSLPRVLQTELHNIPAHVPYLGVPETARAKWRDRFLDVPGMKVGLVWRGDAKHPRDQQRSIALAKLAPLFDVSGVNWISLQKGEAVGELAELGLTEIVDLSAQLQDYADTAAVLEHLDLVVTVDTSVAHLAGAIGSPVFLLLPYAADWRWLENRTDSPWYPSMRLFRQATPDDWSGAVEQTRRAITELLTSKSAGLPAPADACLEPPAVVASDSRLVTRNHSTAPLARACRTKFGMIQYFPGTDPLSKSVEYYGEYLQTQLDIVGRFARPGAIIVEAGAGIGVHSIALAERVDENGQVLAIERSRALRRILRQNLYANEISAVSIMPSTATRCRLDELSIERLDFLKINDRAYSEEMLEGGRDTLWRCRPVVLSVQPTSEIVDDEVRRIADFGYRCWRVASLFFSPSNFNGLDDDIFNGAHSLALLAIPEERDSSMMNTNSISHIQPIV